MSDPSVPFNINDFYEISFSWRHAVVLQQYHFYSNLELVKANQNAHLKPNLIWHNKVKLVRFVKYWNDKF